MIHRASPISTRRITVRADTAYDAAAFVAGLRRMYTSPHITAKAHHSAIDGRPARHAGYKVSQQKRKPVDEPFGWGKTVRSIAQMMLRGIERIGPQFRMMMTAYTLAKLPRLLAA